MFNMRKLDLKELKEVTGDITRKRWSRTKLAGILFKKMTSKVTFLGQCYSKAIQSNIR